MKGDLLRWGICCAGSISNDFTVGVSLLPKDRHFLQAVAASKLERAQAFATKHGVNTAYGSYEDLSRDPEVDVVYIGSIHTQHYKLSKLMLEAGKPVICEKPLSLHPAQVKDLIQLAKSKNLFLMEGIWSRCFPAYKFLSDVIEKGEIGEVRSVNCTFGDYVPETAPCWYWVSGKEHGGGALNDRGVYPLQMAQFIFKEKPISQITSGILNEDGVDMMSSIILKYSNNKMATLSFSLTCEFKNEALIGGTKGTICIHNPFWCPTKITVNGVDHEFTVPDTTKPLNYRNSAGLSYEADEVYNCMKHNLLESPLVSHQTSTVISEIVYKARKELGYNLSLDEEWDKT